MKTESAQIVKCQVNISSWFVQDWEKAEMKITSPTGKSITVQKTVLNMELTQLEKVLLTIIGECKDGTVLLTRGQMIMLLGLSNKKYYRFALRERPELVKDHGKQYVELLENSLTSYFKKSKEITEHKFSDKNEYFLLVPSTYQNSEIDFQFSIVSKKYDVYILEFIGSIG